MSKRRPETASVAHESEAQVRRLRRKERRRSHARSSDPRRSKVVGLSGAGSSTLPTGLHGIKSVQAHPSLGSATMRCVVVVLTLLSPSQGTCKAYQMSFKELLAVARQIAHSASDATLVLRLQYVARHHSVSQVPLGNENMSGVWTKLHVAGQMCTSNELALRAGLWHSLTPPVFREETALGLCLRIATAKAALKPLREIRRHLHCAQASPQFSIDALGFLQRVFYHQA
eukprot:2394907-Amphidinium_carterae.2